MVPPIPWPESGGGQTSCPPYNPDGKGPGDGAGSGRELEGALDGLALALLTLELAVDGGRGGGGGDGELDGAVGLVQGDPEGRVLPLQLPVQRPRSPDFRRMTPATSLPFCTRTATTWSSVFPMRNCPYQMREREAGSTASAVLLSWKA